MKFSISGGKAAPLAAAAAAGGANVAIDASARSTQSYSNNIIILNAKKNRCETIPLKDVNRFNLRYAKPKHYGWTIPTAIILPAIHGVYSLFTIPLNLIVTISVTSSGENAFTYNKKNITFDKLKMFARFPQGLPLNIDIAGIK